MRSIDESWIAARETEYGATISFTAHDLNSDARIARGGDRRCASASIIKLPILVHLALAAAEGQIDWHERLSLAASDKVPGYGILRNLDADLALSMRDLATLMTALSDNTASNMLIDRLGIDAINARTRALGLATTTLHRKVYMPNTPAMLPYGLGVTTTDEIVQLLMLIERQHLGTPAASELVLTLLAAQQDRAGIPRSLPDGWYYAGKTGSDSDLRNDCGIISGPVGEHYALAIFCQQLPHTPATVDHSGWRLIGAITAALLGV